MNKNKSDWIQKTAFLSITALFFLIPALHAQDKETCKEVHDGIFFSYPKNTGERWKSERNGDVQTEINLGTGDSSKWKINWQNDCRFTMKYSAGGKDFKPGQMQWLKDHVLAFEINSVGPDYYTFSQYYDKVSKKPVLSDTMWLTERSNASANDLFIPIDPKSIRKAKFKDTSQYALLYVYRSSKFVCSVIDYAVTANNMPLCLVENKTTAYVFKVLKTGPIQFIATNKKRSTKEEVSIQFGHKYYLKCDLHWSMDHCIPDIKIVDESKGLTEFAEAQAGN